MKLVFAIVNDEDSPKLMSELNHSGYGVTKLNSSGGFLRSGNTTLMIVVEDEKKEEVFSIIKAHSSKRKTAINAGISPTAGVPSTGGSFLPFPLEVNVGGATIFVVNVEQFEKI